MRKKFSFHFILGFLFSITLLLIAGLIPSQTAAAKHVTGVSIEDGAGLLTDREIKDLTAKMTAFEDKRNVDIVIITLSDRGSSTPKRYMEDYYDANFNSGKLSKDAVMMFISMNDRWVEFQGYGKGKTYLSDSRIDDLYQDIKPYLSKGNYSNAFEFFVDRADSYLGNHPNPLFHTWLQLLIAIAIGGISVAVMVSHSSGKVTTNNRTYLDAAHSGLVSKRDSYITTTVRRIHHPKPSSTGGGGRSGGGFSGGGRSSGGHSHSGGGGHF